MISLNSANARSHHQPNQGLVAFPRDVLLMHDVESLFLEANEIRELPDDLHRLTALRTLVVARNRLRRIDASLARVTTLLRLDLSNNQLDSLPAEFGSLALRSLRLDSNAFKGVFPVAIFQLTQLENFSAANNVDVRELSSDIQNWTRLTRLELRSCAIQQLPSALFKLSQLEALHVAHNQISVLPAHVSQLVRLSSLTLANNALDTIPLEIMHATSLVYLFASHNSLHSLPDSLGAIRSLDYIEFQQNAFENDAEIRSICEAHDFLVHRANRLCSLLRQRNARRRRAAAGLLSLSKLLLAPSVTPMFALGRGDLEQLPSHVIRLILDLLVADRFTAPLDALLSVLARSIK